MEDFFIFSEDLKLIEDCNILLEYVDMSISVYFLDVVINNYFVVV